MTGTFVINGLAGLLVITSLLVICVRKPTSSAVYYALQSLVLVLIFLAMAQLKGAHELNVWAVTAFLTKVILVPVVMYRSLGHLKDPAADTPLINTALTVTASAVIIALSYTVVSHIRLSAVVELKPALGISLAHFFLGLLCIVTQRNILKQIFGYCLMENGSHLTLAILASNVPEIVEVGIATDAIFTVMVMVVIARGIHHTLNTLDVRKLTALKG
ncbi:MAG: hydrogenase 4 membrane subunit [Burkholderiaceae bacterium]|jgi:hydrogenase-4 component E|nr:hydrogenase 4 membrane subunit [Burkholderiaceae bacterium]